MQVTTDELLTVSEVARKLRLTKQYIYNLVSKGAIPHIKLSHKVLRFDPAAIDRWVSERTRVN